MNAQAPCRTILGDAHQEVFDGLSAGPPPPADDLRSAIAGGCAGCGGWFRRNPLLDDRPLSGLDRRRLCEGQFDSVAPKVAGYVAQLLVDDDPAGQGRAVLADRRDFAPRSTSSPMWRPRRLRSPISMPRSPRGSAIRQADAAVTASRGPHRWASPSATTSAGRRWPGSAMVRSSRRTARRPMRRRRAPRRSAFAPPRSRPASRSRC